MKCHDSHIFVSTLTVISGHMDNLIYRPLQCPNVKLFVTVKPATIYHENFNYFGNNYHLPFVYITFSVSDYQNMWGFFPMAKWLRWLFRPIHQKVEICPPIRAHAWVGGSMPDQGPFSLTSISFFLSVCLSF